MAAAKQRTTDVHYPVPDFETQYRIPAGFIFSVLDPVPARLMNTSPFCDASVLLPSALARNVYLTEVILPLFINDSNIVAERASWSVDKPKVIFVDRRLWTSTQDVIREALNTSLTTGETIAVWDWAVLDYLLSIDRDPDNATNRRATSLMANRYLVGIIEEVVTSEDLTDKYVRSKSEQGLVEAVSRDDEDFNLRLPRVAAQQTMTSHKDAEGRKLVNVLLNGGVTSVEAVQELVEAWYTSKGSGVAEGLGGMTLQD